MFCWRSLNLIVCHLRSVCRTACILQLLLSAVFYSSIGYSFLLKSFRFSSSLPCSVQSMLLPSVLVYSARCHSIGSFAMFHLLLQSILLCLILFYPDLLCWFCPSSFIRFCSMLMYSCLGLLRRPVLFLVFYSMLSPCVVLSRAVLCRAVPCRAVMCCVVLCCVVLCCVVLR